MHAEPLIDELAARGGRDAASSVRSIAGEPPRFFS